MQPVHAPVPSGIHGVLSVLADLADTESGGGRRTRPSAPPATFRWLPLSNLRALANPDAGIPLEIGRRQVVQHLAAIDAIRPGENNLRLGWLWAAGRFPDGDGGTVTAFEPLVTAEVVMRDEAATVTGDLLVSPLIEDHTTRLQLEARVVGALGGGVFAGMGPDAPAAMIHHMPNLRAFAEQAAAAAGLPATRMTSAHSTPAWFAEREDPRIVVGLGIYAAETRPDFSAAGSLRLWHERIGNTWTALHALYLDRGGPPAQPGDDIPSAYRLTVAQHRCVVEARTAPVTVISGAPGTGKTHTIAAIVGDAVAHGRSVLVAAKSPATVQAVSELVAARPGPDPVRFGSVHDRYDLSRRLAAGRPTPIPGAETDRRHAAMAEALERRDELWTDLARALHGLELLGDHARARALRDRLPGLGRPDVSLHEVATLAAETRLQPPAWHQFGRRRRWRRLVELLGTSTPPDRADLYDAIALAIATRGLVDGAGRLDAGLGLDSLLAAQDRLEHLTGEWMDALARDERRLTREVRGARGALATALRSGRATRRAKLAELGRHVTTALPVWVGTLGDIDDLLPMHPALFDLVILDEASSIDQPRAATALLRGQRAVVVGDPQQLRHVSFLPTAAVDAARAAHLPDASPALAAKLDARANSIFDVAASTAPVRQLDEHFRSGPHLFDFVGRELYDGTVALVTATPANADEDLIDVTRLDDARGPDKVVAAEVDAVLDRLAALHAAGADSVGVISPFRAQADAIEQAALDRLRHVGIRELGLRVGTVHAFQGMERDVVIVSLGIGTGDGPAVWRFADDPHLFAVMATRARRRIEWLVSADPPDGSLIGAYLVESDRPPGAATAPVRGTSWTVRLSGALVDAGLSVGAPYRVGRHAVDLCVLDADPALAVETSVHPGGPHDHIRRHLELRQAGWSVATVLEHVWGDRLGEVAVQLRHHALSGTPPVTSR